MGTLSLSLHVYVCVCVCVRACVRACVCVCVKTSETVVLLLNITLLVFREVSSVALSQFAVHVSRSRWNGFVPAESSMLGQHQHCFLVHNMPGKSNQNMNNSPSSERLGRP